jgi:uncharacterized protein YbdZ (MbtH family)
MGAKFSLWHKAKRAEVTGGWRKLQEENKQ